MKRILIAVAALGVAAAIAIGTQRSLPRVEEEADVVGAAVPAARPPAVDAAKDTTAGLDPDTPVSSDGQVGAPTDAGGSDASSGGSAPSYGGSAPARGSAGAEPAAPRVDAPPTQRAQASPDEILARASEAYAAVRTMQADFRMAVTNPLLRRTTNSAGTLYQQRPDRIALRFTEPAGDAIVGDGTWFWVYYPSVNPDQVVRMPASQGASGGVDLQAQFLGNPTERFNATLHGTENVGGRDAHVLTLVPRNDAAYASLKVWLDTRDHLARRFEITEENGAVRRFELSNLRTNIALEGDVFRFTPPAGARIVERS